jgi:ATP-dependent DNA helicase RecG
VVRVEESPIKPVWAFGRPYKRVGRTNQGLTREETQRLVETTHGRTWDALPCARLGPEHLDRAKVETYLRRAGQDKTTTTETLLENLDLRQGELLTNAAALLFALDPQRWVSGSQIQCARFQGKTSVRFLNEQTFYGDVISQVDEAIAFIARNTRQTPHITGQPARDIISEYPADAVREAVINAVCHRDYAALGTVQIRIYDDRLEIWNPGALPPSLSFEALYQEHASHPRNKRIADVFHRARLIERWGTGTLRMAEAYTAQNLPPPEFLYQSGSFLVRMQPVPFALAAALDLSGLNERQRNAIEYVLEKGSISFGEYKSLSHVSERQARYDLNDMVEKGHFVRTGQSRATRYMLADLSA